MSVFEEDTKKRLVLITDGSETKGDAVSIRNMLKNENIQTLIYDVSGNVKQEAGIREIALPQYVNINMEYDVNVIVDSIGSQKANLRLYRGTSLVLNEQVNLRDGENRYVFTDKAEKGGGITYHSHLGTFSFGNSIATKSAAHDGYASRFLDGKLFFSSSAKRQGWKNKTDEVPPYCLRTIELCALPYFARMFIPFYPRFPFHRSSPYAIIKPALPKEEFPPCRKNIWNVAYSRCLFC